MEFSEKIWIESHSNKAMYSEMIKKFEKAYEKLKKNYKFNKVKLRIKQDYYRLYATYKSLDNRIILSWNDKEYEISFNNNDIEGYYKNSNWTFINRENGLPCPIIRQKD